MEPSPYNQPGYQFPQNDNQRQHRVPHHALPYYEHAPHNTHPVQEASGRPQPSQSELAPQPVVQVLSPRGIEYVFLTISLFIGAFGLGLALIAVVNGQFQAAVLGFPVACLVTALPIFSWLFLRLKQAELRDPALRTDPSKRRTTQLTQIIGFIVALFSIVGLITALTAKIAGNFDASVLKIILNALIVFLISGGILYYYWRDEHQ